MEKVESDPSAYNYQHFDREVEQGREEAEFNAFFSQLHAGEHAPDFTALRLNDLQQVRVSNLWQDQNLVMEFGSFT